MPIPSMSIENTKNERFSGNMMRDNITILIDFFREMRVKTLHGSTKNLMEEEIRIIKQKPRLLQPICTCSSCRLAIIRIFRSAVKKSQSA